MDILTIIGFLLGVGVIYYVMLQGEITALLFNFNAFLLVFGGTFASTMITYPWSLLRRIPISVIFIFRPQKTQTSKELIEQMVNLQFLVHSNGIDALSDELNKIDNKFLATGLRMILEDQDVKSIKENLSNELNSIRHRHQQVIGVFRSMGSYAPIFGLLGTLIGVVQVLRNLSDAGAMGSSMAIAITTTFYGIFGCNFIFLPIAGKLNGYSNDELFSKELILVGIVSLRTGILPVLMRQKLERFITEEHRE